jgi:hypothetical protein
MLSTLGIAWSQLTRYLGLTRVELWRAITTTRILTKCETTQAQWISATARWGRTRIRFGVAHIYVLIAPLKRGSKPVKVSKHARYFGKLGIEVSTQQTTSGTTILRIFGKYLFDVFTNY